MSCWNDGEIDIVKNLYIHLKEMFKNVVNISLYKDQSTRLKDLFNKNDGLKAHADKIITVDSSQGSEADVVILRAVRSNPKGVIGPFVNDRNRLNVALSLAKEHLFIVGNRDLFKSTKENGNLQIKYRMVKTY